LGGGSPVAGSKRKHLFSPEKGTTALQLAGRQSAWLNAPGVVDVQAGVSQEKKAEHMTQRLQGR